MLSSLILAPNVCEKHRCAHHSALETALNVLEHSGAVHLPLELARHARCVQSQLARVGEQMLIVERSLSPEQEIVHLPELALRACRLCHLGRGLGLRV